MDFTKYFATRLARLVTPQREAIPNTPQVANSAGGYAWPVDQWTRLDRFLVLGSEGGTYYVGERELTRRERAGRGRVPRRATAPRLVRRIVEMSASGPGAEERSGALRPRDGGRGWVTPRPRRWRCEALPQVARTGTHLFHWLQYVQAFRGWGRGVRRAVAAWYTAKPADAGCATRSSSTRAATGGRTATHCGWRTRRRRAWRTTWCSATPRRDGRAS